jgi:hypothetical protein
MKPDSGLGLEGKVLKTLQGVPFSLGSSTTKLRRGGGILVAEAQGPESSLDCLICGLTVLSMP